MTDAKKAETKKPDEKVVFNFAHTVNRTEYKKGDSANVRPHIADRLEKKEIAKRA